MMERDRVKMADLPEPDVQVDTSIMHQETFSHRVKVTVRRDGANHGEPKTWEGRGGTIQDSIKDVVKQIIRDPLTGEFSEPSPSPNKGV